MSCERSCAKSWIPGKVGCFFLVAAVLCVAALPGWGQLVSGDITGTVYDATGAVVPNATVVAKNDATAVETSTKSTSAGVYRVSNLPVGTYTLTVTAGGFTKSEIRDVAVKLNVVATANVTLQVGQTTERVDVSAAPAMVDTTSANVEGDFNTREVMQLPTASTGSGVLNLSLLNAGVASSGAVGVGSGPSVGGQRPRNNNFMVEGIDNNSGSVTGPLVTVPNDAVSEFSVQQNMYSPEFGHSSGGQFNEVIKSGTNSFHGEAHEYLENRNFNAADNLAAVDKTPLHPRYDNNRFGGDFGGPIKKNKLFFYGLYEYNPIGEAGSAGLLFAPTAAGWSTIQSFANTPGFNQTSMNQLKKYLGTAPTAAAPATTPNKAYPLVGPGNISLGQQNAATALPVEIGQIGISAPSYTNNEFGVASVDYNPNEKDAVRGRFVLNRSGFIDTAASLPVFYTTVPSNNYLVTFSEFHTFSPELVNEFRLGYNRYSNTYPAGNFTWPGLDQFPNVQVFDLSAQIGPDPNAPQFGYQNQYQLTDNITWTKGSHSLKFGFDGWRQISPQGFTQRARGDYEWSNLSDYLFDYNPDYLAQRSLGNATYWGNRWFEGVFVNDTWKIRPNLSLNLGLRWEYNSVPASEELQSLNAISNVPGLITFQSPTAQKDNWMPRVGIAWSPGTSGRTSIRAGFGRSYDVLFDNLGLLTLPPQMITTVDLTGLDQSGFLAHGGIPPTATGSALSQADARAGTGGYIPNQVRPESLQWNFGIQHVFHNDYTFESRYMGTRGLFLPVQIQLNRQPVVNGANALPVYFSAPSQATLNGLPNTLAALTAAYNAHGDIMPAYLAAGFTGIITSYQPWGSSTYHGWANQLTRRFSNGMQFIAAYTYSHDIDNSTAEVFSTYITPRRPQDSTRLNNDRSSSALDHRQRLTAAMVYESQWYNRSSNWFLKNIVGNWEFAPIYTYQTGTLWDVQSGLDTNMNGDSAGDRAILNPNGVVATGTGTTPLKNANGDTVAYLVNNPNAMYVRAPQGTISTAGRNTEHLNPINDVDMTFTKRIAFTENYHLELSGRFLNIFNHPQYTGGYLNDIAPIGATSSAQHNFLIPSNAIFANPSMAFSSNPRSIQICARFIF
jgi:hypothetical protein